MHKYQVYNDKHHWPSILASSEDFGPIYHMDYSKNIAQMYKYKPQSSHFSKQQYSLHCTVRTKYLDSQPTHNYLYDLSDEMKHDYAFTASVVDHVLSPEDLLETLRFKLDNYSTKYKSKYVFEYWRLQSVKCNRSVIVYYGVSGHGKGSVNAMCGFGLKVQLKRLCCGRIFHIVRHWISRSI